MAARLRIGELLISNGLLTQAQLDEALNRQQDMGASDRRLGQLLVDLGFVSEVQLTKLLSQQLSVPWVSLHHIDFSRQLLNLVPREVAEQFCVVPVYVRHERRTGDTLYLAMEDPTHEDAIRRVGASCSLPVKPMIAPPSDIRAAIRAYYGRPSMLPDAVGVSVPDAPAPAAAASPAAMTRPEGVRRPAPPPVPAAPKPPPPPPAASRGDGGLDAKVPPPAESAAEPTSPTSGPTVEVSSPEIKPSAPPNVTPVVAVEPSASPAPSADATDRVAAVAQETVSEAPGAPASASAPQGPPATPPAADARPVEPRPRTRSGGVKRSAASQGGDARPRKMLALTFLDGTTLSIPAQKKKSGGADEIEAAADGSHEEQLTARDLIAALRAVANGTATKDDALGDATWERLFAALLSVLLKKQLVADWEFVEEWQKM